MRLLWFPVLMAAAFDRGGKVLWQIGDRDKSQQPSRPGPVAIHGDLCVDSGGWCSRKVECPELGPSALAETDGEDTKPYVPSMRQINPRLMD